MPKRGTPMELQLWQIHPCRTTSQLEVANWRDMFRIASKWWTHTPCIFIYHHLYQFLNFAVGVGKTCDPVMVPFLVPAPTLRFPSVSLGFGVLYRSWSPQLLWSNTRTQNEATFRCDRSHHGFVGFPPPLREAGWWFYRCFSHVFFPHVFCPKWGRHMKYENMQSLSFYQLIVFVSDYFAS